VNIAARTIGVLLASWIISVACVNLRSKVATAPSPDERFTSTEPPFSYYGIADRAYGFRLLCACGRHGDPVFNDEQDIAWR